MNHRQIIGEAWEYTQTHKKKVMGYAFWPSLVATMYGIIYMIYQFYAIKSSPLVENWNRSFSYYAATTVIQILRDNISIVWPLIFFAIFVVIVYFLLPPLCEGAMIQIIARHRNNQQINRFDGLKWGMFSFLPLLEYLILVRTFSLNTVLTEISFVGRNLGINALYTFIPIFITIALTIVFMGLLFTYTEYFIVIDGRKVIESITKSCVLVIKHLSETLLLTILMLIISLRIVIQIVFVILIPFIFLGVIYLSTLASMETLGIAVGIVLGVALLYLAAYLGGVIHVFATTVWTYTFLELTSMKEVNARGEPVEEKGKEEEKEIKVVIEKKD